MTTRIKPIERATLTKGQRRIVVTMYRRVCDLGRERLAQLQPLFRPEDKQEADRVLTDMGVLRAVFRKLAPPRKKEAKA